MIWVAFGTLLLADSFRVGNFEFQLETNGRMDKRSCFFSVEFALLASLKGV